MATKKKPDYMNLPFEVHYKLLTARNYEFLHKLGVNPKLPNDYLGVVIDEARAWNITFRSENSNNGSLAFVLAGKLNGFIPDWLEYEEEELYDSKYQETREFKVVRGKIVYGDQLDRDDLEDEGYDYGPSETFYSCAGAKPDYLILDADGSCVYVDLLGYRLAQDDTRMDKSPIVSIKEFDMTKVTVKSKTSKDVELDVLNLLKS